MIKEIKEDNLAQCVQLIRESFQTVADVFGFTVENAPGFTAFATTEDRLKWHMYGEKRPMFGYFDGERIVGYYSLLMQENHQCELSNLCVLPSDRHQGIGEALLQHAFAQAKGLQCDQVNIGIVEENRVLRVWYESFGFEHLGTRKFDRFPFTCGFLKKKI